METEEERELRIWGPTVVCPFCGSDYWERMMKDDGVPDDECIRICELDPKSDEANLGEPYQCVKCGAFWVEGMPDVTSSRTNDVEKEVK